MSLASVSEVVIGFVYGWASVALPLLEGEAWPWRIDENQSSWIVSLVDIGSLVIAIPAGLLANRVGRRMVLLSSALFFLASWIMILFATSVEWLYVARLLAGMGGGTVFTVNTMYWGEIASPAFRGSASSLTQAMLFFGILLADVIGYLAPTEYTTLALCGAGVTVVFVACFFFTPESPYYLLMRGRPDLAKLALQRLRGKEDVAAELVPLEEALSADLALGSDTQLGCGNMLRTRGARRALFISVVVGALQRLSGLSAVIAYTSSTLPKDMAELGPMLIGAVLFLASFGPLVLMDRLGRRPLLILSSIVVAASMASNGFYFQFVGALCPAAAESGNLSWVPLLGLVAYAVAYALGMGPVPDILPGEVFPTSVKGLAVSGVNISLTLFTFLVSKIYNVMGVQYMYWGFAVVGVLTALFAAFVIPETRGKTLEQVVDELEGRGRRRRPAPEAEAADGAV
ncbi:hypothetical protein ONE63_008952 [Megalurothrips usitatus]|uniref:Major facilitator superfamily (MFS) profile domain-containing protein n=1 Tax=Megalurothrips usitatus TaxID=439358 RepID=A0AAV7XI54_9NEOP|nr:hypothetical protein ONE63_008952 [Megalurothrips usitatus]